MATRLSKRYLEWVLNTKGAIEKIDGDKWIVKSERGDGTYIVSVSSTTVYCECPGFKLASDDECKHVKLIKLLTIAMIAMNCRPSEAGRHVGPGAAKR